MLSLSLSPLISKEFRLIRRRNAISKIHNFIKQDFWFKLIGQGPLSTFSLDVQVNIVHLLINLV